MTVTLIATTTVTDGSTNRIDFNSIPADYTDLLLVVSARTQQAVTVATLFAWIGTTLSSAIRTANYSARLLEAAGPDSGPFTSAQTADGQWNISIAVPGANSTANTFSSYSIYIPNYTGSTTKSISAEAVGENNAAQAYHAIFSGLVNAANAQAPMTRFAVETIGNMAIGSTASLYGITKGSSGGVTVS
jgi:hypothetical protein